MAERLRIEIQKIFCEQALENIETMEIYKDIMDGDSIITSFLTEVGCLKFRQCNHSECPIRKDVLAPEGLRQYLKQKDFQDSKENLASTKG